MIVSIIPLTSTSVQEYAGKVFGIKLKVIWNDAKRWAAQSRIDL